jgi:hypothetical protein
MKNILILMTVGLACGSVGLLFGQSENKPTFSGSEENQFGFELEQLPPEERGAAIAQRDATKPKPQHSPEELRAAYQAELDRNTAALTDDQKNAVMAMFEHVFEIRRRGITDPIDQQFNYVQSKYDGMHRAHQEHRLALEARVAALEAKLAE